MLACFYRKGAEAQRRETVGNKGWLKVMKHEH